MEVSRGRWPRLVRGLCSLRLSRVPGSSSVASPLLDLILLLHKVQDGLLPSPCSGGSLWEVGGRGQGPEFSRPLPSSSIGRNFIHMAKPNFSGMESTLFIVDGYVSS